MKLGILTFLLLFNLGDSRFEDTRNLSQTCQCAGAIAELLESRTLDPRHFESEDKDYLLARLAAKDGQLTLSIASFRNAADRGSPLAPYALAHLSRLAAETGNLLLERIYLDRLRLEYPNSVITQAVSDRLARNALASGAPQLAINVLTAVPPLSTQTKTSNHRERTAMLGQAYAMAGDPALARSAFTSLLNLTSNPSQPDNAALSAVRALDALDEADTVAGDHPPGISVEDRMLRGGIYQFFRDFAAARKHHEVVARDFVGTAHATAAILQTGRGFVQIGDNAGALQWFDQVINEYPQSPDAKDALLAAAAAESRLGHPENAIARYESYIGKYPDDERIDRAYFNIVDVLRDSGDDHAALEWCAKAGNVFKGKPAEAVAIFTAARIYIAREDWQNALDRLDQLKTFRDLGGAAIPGGTSAAEVSFLKGQLLEKLGRQPEAVESYRSIPRGRESYYGWLAADEVSTGTAEVSSATRAIPKLPNSTIWSPDPVASKLISLALYDDAIVQISSDSTVPPYELANYALKGDQAYRTLSYIEPVWREMPKDMRVAQIPRPQAEMLYPVVYSDQLLRVSPSRGVDPRLLLAIMRQESRFQPDANSNAAARGLMQFIAPTADRIATNLGGAIDPEDLYDPSTNILLGAQYTAELFKLFPNQPEAVVASYNAGEDNVARWVKRSRSDLPDRYVPEIMYTQTKDYVYKVMSNYRMYCYLYDEMLRPNQN